MTEEQMKARIAELEAEKTAILTKNSELIDREKTAKSDAARAAGDIEALEKSLRDEHTKDVTNLRKDLDKANKAAEAAIAARRTDQLTSAIANAAAKSNVIPEALDALSALAKAKHSFDGDAPLIDGKPVDEWFTEYVGADTGAWARRASDNVGTGASGSTQTKSNPVSNMTSQTFNMTEFSQYAREHGDAAANALADKLQMPHLKV